MKRSANILLSEQSSVQTEDCSVDRSSCNHIYLENILLYGTYNAEILSTKSFMKICAKIFCFENLLKSFFLLNNAKSVTLNIIFNVKCLSILLVRYN